MGTTAQKLQRILETKTGFKNLITEKGGVITETTTFHEYIDEARKLMEGGKVVVEEVKEYLPLPIGEVVEKVYINNSLTDEEVKAIISNCDWSSETSFMGYHFLFNNPDAGLSLMIVDYTAFNNEVPAYALVANQNGEYAWFWIDPALTKVNTDMGRGWINETFEYLGGNEIPIGLASVVTIEDTYDGVAYQLNVGTFNEQLSKLVNIGTKVSKQPVPSREYIDIITFNVSLTSEEVDALITNANLTFKDNQDEMSFTYKIIDDDYGRDLTLNKILMNDTSCYTILDVHTGFVIYCTPAIASMANLPFTGWNPDLVDQHGLWEYKHTNSSSYSRTENDKLIDLVYVGSELFKKELTGIYEAVTTDITENGEVDLTTYWDNQQMLIKVNVNIEGAGDSGVPLQPATEEEMNNLLVNENIGKVFLYTGETNANFTNGEYYIIEEVTE